MNGGFFSQITSIFGGTSGGTSNGPSSRNTGKSSVFGSGFPSSSRRGPPSRLDDAWSLPYNYGNSANGLSSGSLASPNTAYPPPSSASAGRYPQQHGGLASDSVAHLASQSSHNLVAPGRSSLMDARTATGVSIPSTSFPPLRHTWNRIRNWSENHYPELKDTLNWAATDAQLDELEYTLGFSLPPAVRESYRCYNGQELESNQSCSDGIFFGLPLLSVDQVAQEWNFWRAVDDDVTAGANPEVRQWQSSCPDKWVRAEYSCRGWIPLISDRVGNYIGVDLTPHPSGGGAPGQVIIFGRDFDTKVVLWRGEGEGGWGRFLQYFAEELENGEMWSLEEPTSGSDEEEDAIGYESYFTGGGSGGSRGGGDRGGEGAAGFRLCGEYKGWPVMEAWADRSMRCWEEVGLPVGVPAGQGEMPSVRLSGVDENGESLDAEGSSRGYASPRESMSGSASAGRASLDIGGPAHPLQGAPDNYDVSGGLSPSLSTGRPFSPSGELHSPTMGGQNANGLPGRRISDTLSPPPSTTKASRSRQKQRENAAVSSPSASKPRSSMPAPAQPLDLPTIDDVRAAKAAALAEHERSARVQYSDLESSVSAMSLGRNGTIRAGTGGAGGGGGSGGGGHGSHRLDAVELENRNSSDGNGMNHRRGPNGSLADVVVIGESRRSLQSPTVRSPRTSSEQRPNFFDSPSTSTAQNLIDGSAPNSPNLGGSSSGAFMSPASSSSSNMMASPLGGGGAGGSNYVSSPLGAVNSAAQLRNGGLRNSNNDLDSGNSTPTKQQQQQQQLSRTAGGSGVGATMNADADGDTSLASSSTDSMTSLQRVALVDGQSA